MGDTAIRKFNGSSFQGRILEVRRDKKSSASPATATTVFISNLDYDCSWQDLKDYVQRCGRVEHVDIPKRGWAIVTFATQEEGASAISRLDGTVFQNRPLEVRWDRKSGGDSYDDDGENESSSRQLYVGNLSYDCTWQN